MGRHGSHHVSRRGMHRSVQPDAGVLRRIVGFMESTVPKRVEPPRITNVLVVSGVILGLLLFGYSTTQIYLQFGSDPDATEVPGSLEGVRPTEGTADRGGAVSPSEGGEDEVQAGIEPIMVGYEITAADAEGFTARITVTNSSLVRLEGWELALAFESARVTEVRGAAWEHFEDGILARRPAGGTDLVSGASTTLEIDVRGTAQDPVRCSLNGHVCTP
ncbi:cellulose binding domain-containing protein [Nocardiopsis sp. LOL_012]|uniref:cellulose binding domain-containing protein n=1 Tax=Nocardiopsis sp. LOL_012 TaxID=3345409 RepID=UPI003A8AA4FE